MEASATKVQPAPRDPSQQHPPVDQPAGDPWPIDITGHDNPPECKCSPPPKKAPQPPCTRSKPKKDDCCERILAILGAGANGTGDHKIHKPKTPRKVRLANYCCDLPVRDALGPLLVLLNKRVVKGLAPQNAFETSMYGWLKGLDARHRNALQVGIDAYAEIPAARRCSLETRLDDWPDDRPLDVEFLRKVVLKEIVELGRLGVFNISDGQPSVGEMRLWDLGVGPIVDAKPAMVTAPWPWICSVNPGADKVKWYRNQDVVLPDKADISREKFELHEYAKLCTASIPDPANPTNILVDCADDVPPAGTFGICNGGGKYNLIEKGALRCIAVPKCVAGQGIALRGFNFTSLNCTVVIKKVGGGFPDMVERCDVMGDDKAPTKAASCLVRDMITFVLPRSIRDFGSSGDIPVPPGRYTIEVHVPNESNYAPTPGIAPAEFVSNQALIDVIPPVDIPYQIWVESGNCYTETDGPGGDEPWFRSYKATYRPGVAQNVETGVADIFKQETIDSGDWIGFPRVSPFSGKLEAGHYVGIAILGLEVDNATAAEEQIASFGEAYGMYWEQALTVMGVGAAVGLPGITGSVVAGGIALLAIAFIGLFWAAWAPADTLAYDLMVYDAFTLFHLTTPGGVKPPSDAGQIAEITWIRNPLGIEPKSASTAEYTEERRYLSSDEGSDYALSLRIEQLPPA